METTTEYYEIARIQGIDSEFIVEQNVAVEYRIREVAEGHNGITNLPDGFSFRQAMNHAVTMVEAAL